MIKIKRYLYKFWLLFYICRIDRKINKSIKILEKSYASK